MKLIKSAEQLKSYRLPGIFFKKYWFWFKQPFDAAGADMVNFFSYDDCSRTDFHKKEGLTTTIDLGPSEEQIWLKMRRGFIRQQINKGERNGIIVRQDDNFKKFKKIYLNFRKKKKLHGDRFAVFEKNGIEFSAYWRDEMIAGGIFIADSNYMRALALASERLDGLDGKRREIIGQANRLLIWEAIKYAKKNNLKIFDLGGIAPDSSSKEQRTLAEFKEAFGGERKKTYYYFKVYSRSLKFLMRLKGYKDL